MKRSSWWSRVLVALGLVLLGALLACGGGGEGSGDPPRPTTGSMRVVNGSTGFAMRELYVALHTATTWGSNQLAGQNLPAGSGIVLTQMPPGTYDVKAVWTDGVESEKESLSVSIGVITEVTMIDTGTLRVTNGDTFAMTQLYVTNSTSTWGPDRLTPDLAPGGTVTLTRLDPGVYDVRAVWSDGTAYEELSITIWPDFTTSLSILPLSSTEGAIRIINGLGIPMTQLYVPGSVAPDWGPNQLGGQSLAGGGSILLTLMPPDRYDVKSVWNNGSTHESMSHTLEAGQTLNITMAPVGSSWAARSARPAAATRLGSLLRDGQALPFRLAPDSGGEAKAPRESCRQEGQPDLTVPFQRGLPTSGSEPARRRP